MKTELSSILFQIKRDLQKTQGADIVRDFVSLDGQVIRVHAFIAGGQVRPGSFRSNWTVDGVQMSKTAACKIIR